MSTTCQFSEFLEKIVWYILHVYFIRLDRQKTKHSQISLSLSAVSPISSICTCVIVRACCTHYFILQNLIINVLYYHFLQKIPWCIVNKCCPPLFYMYMLTCTVFQKYQCLKIGESVLHDCHWLSKIKSSQLRHQRPPHILQGQSNWFTKGNG